MTADTLRVLLVEDNPGDARLVRELLRDCADPTFAVEHVTRLAAALERLARERFDVVLLDLNLPDSSGLQGLGAIVRRGVEVPVIVVTGLDDEAVGVEALRAHASDYLVKGRIDTPTLTRSIRYAIERAHAEKALRESEHRYRSLFDGMTEGFGLHEVICDEAGSPCDYRFLEVNQAFERLTGLRAAEVVGRTFNEVLPGDDPAWVRVFGEVALTGVPVHFENYSPNLQRHYEAYAYRPAPMQFAVVFTDITERKRKEEELHDLNRTLSAHSRSDRAMMRAASEAEYLKEVCRIVVEDCGHAMVWVGFADEDEQRTVRPVAHAGFEEGYLETLRLTWADSERGRGPTGTAIRTGKPIVCGNMLTDPAFGPWREQALARGYASSIALPLASEGRTFGALTIYSRLPDPFSDAEVALLSSLADDLAHGISTLRTREAHTRAEAALATSEQRYRSLVELSPEAILVSRLDAVEFANPAAVGLFGAADATQLVGRSPFDLFHPGIHERMRERIRQLQAGHVVAPVESRIVRLDGEVREVEVAAGPTEGAGGTAAQAILRDITERKRAEEELSAALAEARRRSEEISGLLTAARAVLEHRAFSSAAGPIFECCRALIDAAAGYIAVHTGGAGDEEQVQVVRGGEPGAAEKRFALPTQGSRRDAYATRRPVTDNAVAVAAEWAGILPVGPRRVENVLLVPMVIGDRVTGTLALAGKKGGFTDDDTRLATAFAELAAVALLNSRTLDLLESHQEILEAQVQDRTRELREVAEALKEEVAERRLAEAEARFSEGRFRELFENVVAGVFEADRAREFLSVNRALVTMLGYRSSDELLAVLNSGAVWGGGGQFEDLWQRASREGTLHGEEVALRRADGSLLDGLLSISSVRDDEGTVLSYQGTVADVSALKRAERALEAERHRLRSILETMRDGVCIVGRDGAVEYVNRAMEQQFGLPDDQPCFEYVAGRSDRCPSCRHDEVLEGAPQSWELNVPATGRTYEVFATRLGTEDGSLSKLEIFHDVTERKEAEEAVRAERGRLFAVLDQLPVFVYLRRHDHAVVFANRHFREEFGDPEGRPCYETLNRCDSPCSGCDFARVFAGGETVEWEWAAPNGKSYQVHHYPFLDSDGARLVLALGVDVTERKRAYEAEQRARGTADALREASLALTKDLDLDAVLTTFFGLLRRLVAFDAGAMMLLEEGGSVLRVRATAGPGGRVALPEQPPLVIVMEDNPAVAEILAGHDGRALAGPRERPEWATGPGMEGARAWLGVPLRAGGRAVGMFSLARTHGAAFTEDDRRLAEALSAQAAASIENAVLFEQVQAASARLQALSRRLVDVQETERRAIARELHDEAGQSLTALLFGLRLLEKQVNGDNQTAQQIAELRQTTDAVMDDLHRLATDLHPASLEHLGLVPALQQHLAKVESQSGLAVRFMARGLEGARLPLVVETTVFRIAQEAVTNVLRHAHATRVDVIAERRGDRVVMVVEDDGVGFDPADLAAREGLGRVGMRERAEALGGTLTFETAPGAGTTVIVEVPSAELVTAT